MSELVTVERTDEGVAILRLNQEKRLNALTVEMGEAFARVVETLSADESLRAVVLTGAGRAFSAGGDLDFLRDRADSSAEANAREMRGFYARFLSLRKLPVPVIAAVNGHAIGAGMCLAMACDLRVVADDAKLGATFVGLGLHPGMGATVFFPAAARDHGRYLLLTGKVISGTDAVARGLALSAHPQDTVLDEALAIARDIAAQGPIAVRTCVRSLRLFDEAALERALWREADAQAQCYSSEDLRAGIDAVANKQKPTFAGR